MTLLITILTILAALFTGHPQPHPINIGTAIQVERITLPDGQTAEITTHPGVTIP